jgi:hypothetical protein
LSSELSKEAVLDRDAEGGSILALENTLFEVTKVEGPAAMEDVAAAAATNTTSQVGSTALAMTARAARADVVGLLLLLLAM